MDGATSSCIASLSTGCCTALAVNLEDIDWTERAIRIHSKGDRAREMFFSRQISHYLDDY